MEKRKWKKKEKWKYKKNYLRTFTVLFEFAHSQSAFENTKTTKHVQKSLTFQDGFTSFNNTLPLKAKLYIIERCVEWHICSCISICKFIDVRSLLKMFENYFSVHYFVSFSFSFLHFGGFFVAAIMFQIYYLYEK